MADTHDMWQKISELKDALESGDYSQPSKGYVNQDPDFLPKGFADMYGVMPGDSKDYKKGCDHEWVDIGFNHSKMVCKKCDKDKE